MRTMVEAIEWLQEQGAFVLAPHPAAPEGMYVARYLVEAASGTTLLDRGMLIYPKGEQWVLSPPEEEEGGSEPISCATMEEAVRRAWSLLSSAPGTPT